MAALLARQLVLSTPLQTLRGKRTMRAQNSLANQPPDATHTPAAAKILLAVKFLDFRPRLCFNVGRLGESPRLLFKKSLLFPKKAKVSVATLGLSRPL